MNPVEESHITQGMALVDALRSRGLTVATAESLTAGMVSARIADVPGASDVLRGGVTTYATDSKASVLGIDAGLLHHVVSEAVASAMANQVRRLFAASVGVATTGVAGPDPLDEQLAGSAWIAVATAEGVVSRYLEWPGDRAAVRNGVTGAAIALVLEVIEPLPQIVWSPGIAGQDSSL